jgi:hypothetical protein
MMLKGIDKDTAMLLRLQSDVMSLEVPLQNCYVGKQYSRSCAKGPCQPIEGSFVTECAVKGCKNFTL